MIDLNFQSKRYEWGFKGGSWTKNHQRVSFVKIFKNINGASFAIFGPLFVFEWRNSSFEHLESPRINVYIVFKGRNWTKKRWKMPFSNIFNRPTIAFFDHHCWNTKIWRKFWYHFFNSSDTNGTSKVLNKEIEPKTNDDPILTNFQEINYRKFCHIWPIILIQSISIIT